MKEPTIVSRVAAIRKRRKKHGISIATLADLAGLTHSTIQEMDSESWNPTLKTLAAVERAMSSAMKN